MRSRLKRFPVADVVPKVGTIGGLLWANENIALPSTLFHSITIPLEPFVAETSEGEARHKASVRLEFIELEVPFGGYRTLAGRTFRFPRNPEPGYVDGSMYLGHAHNPVDVDEIAFGRVHGRTIEVRVRAALDFQSEAIGLRNVPRHSFSTALRFGALVIPRELLKGKRDKVAAARALARRFIAEGAYGAPKVDESSVQLRPL